MESTNKAPQIFQAVITIAIACFVALAIATFIAIDKSRTRTACLKAAQSVEQCQAPSEWENLLARALR